MKNPGFSCVTACLPNKEGGFINVVEVPKKMGLSAMEVPARHATKIG
jgi:hypothetical protein